MRNKAFAGPLPDAGASTVFRLRSRSPQATSRQRAHRRSQAGLPIIGGGGGAGILPLARHSADAGNRADPAAGSAFAPGRPHRARSRYLGGNPRSLRPLLADRHTAGADRGLCHSAGEGPRAVRRLRHNPRQAVAVRAQLPAGDPRGYYAGRRKWRRRYQLDSAKLYGTEENRLYFSRRRRLSTIVSISRAI